MKLEDYTLEELLFEIKRRRELEKKEKDKVLRCRTCSFHTNKVDVWGKPNKFTRTQNAVCLKKLSHRGNTKFVLIPNSQTACEKYEKNRE